MRSWILTSSKEWLRSENVIFYIVIWFDVQGSYNVRIKQLKNAIKTFRDPPNHRGGKPLDWKENIFQRACLRQMTIFFLELCIRFVVGRRTSAPGRLVSETFNKESLPSSNERAKEDDKSPVCMFWHRENWSLSQRSMIMVSVLTPSSPQVEPAIKLRKFG